MVADIDKFIKQLQIERPRLRIPGVAKLEMDRVAGRCVYKCRLAGCKAQFMHRSRLKVINTVEFLSNGANCCNNQNKEHVQSLLSISVRLKFGDSFSLDEKVTLNYLCHVYLTGKHCTFFQV